MSAPKMPGLTQEEQRRVEAHLDATVETLARHAMPDRREAIAAGVAEWAMRFAIKAGHLDESRVIVRRVGSKRR